MTQMRNILAVAGVRLSAHYDTLQSILKLSLLHHSKLRSIID